MGHTHTQPTRRTKNEERRSIRSTMTGAMKRAVATGLMLMTMASCALADSSDDDDNNADYDYNDDVMDRVTLTQWIYLGGVLVVGIIMALGALFVCLRSPRPGPTQGWQTDIVSDCCSDPGLYLCAWCFQPCMHGQLVSQFNTGRKDAPLGEPCACLMYSIGNCFCFGILSIFLGRRLRQDIRARYGIADAPSNDFCVHAFCRPCSLVQEIKEVDHRLANGEGHGLQAQHTVVYVNQQPGAVTTMPPKY